MVNFTSYTLHMLQTKAKSKVQIKFSQNRFSMGEIDETNREVNQVILISQILNLQAGFTSTEEK